MIAGRLFVTAVALSMAFGQLAAQDKAEKQTGKKPARDAAGCCEFMTKASSGSRGDCGAKASKTKKAGAEGCCEGEAMTKAKAKKPAGGTPAAPKDKE